MLFIMSMSIAKYGACYIGDRRAVGETNDTGAEIWVERDSDELKRLKLYSSRLVFRGGSTFRRFYLNGMRVNYRLKGKLESSFYDGTYGDKMDVQIGSEQEKNMFELFGSARKAKRKAWENAFDSNFGIN